MNNSAVANSKLLPLVRKVRTPSRAATNVWLVYLVFFAFHVACLAVFFIPATALSLVLCASTYFLQMFGITAGYHRYFSHRSFRTSRPFQFVLACLGCSAAQNGPCWWVARHRHHHRTSDSAEDLHSPVAHSFWWSHSGWILSSQSDGTDVQTVKDLNRYPEIRWLDRNFWAPPFALAVLCLIIGGWSGFVWGFLVSTVLSHHATFTVNSICHLWGRQRYATGDASRNNLFVALITLGEGWHNNHHHYQSSARQGFRWWEIDVSYYMIRLLACVRLVWDVRQPPADKLQAARPLCQQSPQSSAIATGTRLPEEILTTTADASSNHEGQGIKGDTAAWMESKGTRRL